MKKILILVLMAILLTGCGKKSPPVPPKQMMSSQNDVSMKILFLSI